jgi:hypothetical protein
MEPARVVGEVIEGWGGAEQASVIGGGARYPTVSAALLNGTLAHALDFDDTHLPSVLHPSAAVVPAALAAAEISGASGQDLLAAVAAGDELVVRVQWALAAYADPSDHRVHVPVRRRGADRPQLTLQRSPGIDLSASATGTDQPVGQVRWDRWQRVHWTPRLKQGAAVFRDALYDTAR